MKIFRPLRLRRGESGLKRLIAGLPEAPDQLGGRVFDEIRIGDISALTRDCDKIAECNRAGALKPGSRVIQRGERLLVIVYPA